MDAYKLGAEGNKVGLLAWGRQEILNLMYQADTEIETLNNSINEQKDKVREVFHKNWQIFREEWGVFYKENKTWTKRTWDAIGYQTENWMERVKKWREAFALEGGHYEGPASSEKKREGKFPTALVVLGLAAVGGLYAYYKYGDVKDKMKARAWLRAQDEWIENKKKVEAEARRLGDERMSMVRRRYGRSALGV